jgi:hypothetical protein
MAALCDEESRRPGGAARRHLAYPDTLPSDD